MGFGFLSTPMTAGTAAVDSFNGRVGVVTSQANDYTWAQIDKTTSSIADITTKNHNLLENAQGGTTNQYYHMTNAEHTTALDQIAGTFVAETITAKTSSGVTIKAMGGSNVVVLGAGGGQSAAFADGVSSTGQLSGGSLVSGGGVSLKVRTVTDTTNLDGTYYIVLCNKATAMTINLPAAASHENRIYVIKNINVGAVTIDANASETIDGVATKILTQQYQSVTICCNGTGWYML